MIVKINKTFFCQPTSNLHSKYTSSYMYQPHFLFLACRMSLGNRNGPSHLLQGKHSMALKTYQSENQVESILQTERQERKNTLVFYSAVWTSHYFEIEHSLHNTTPVYLIQDNSCREAKKHWKTCVKHYSDTSCIKRVKNIMHLRQDLNLLDGVAIFYVKNGTRILVSWNAAALSFVECMMCWWIICKFHM